jgi:hypothetical protein
MMGKYAPVAGYLTALLFILLCCCADSTVGPANAPPVVQAIGYSIVQTGDTIWVEGRAEDDGEVVKHEWFFEGASQFVETPAGSTFTIAPMSPDTLFECMYRATDNHGLQTVDTTYVWVVEDVGAVTNRIIHPRGGEVYRMGDSVHVRLWPTSIPVTLELVIGRSLFPTGNNKTILPMVQPLISFKIQDVLIDNVWNGSAFVPAEVSPVSDSCKIKVSEYNNPSSYVESAGYFRILPAAQ